MENDFLKDLKSLGVTARLKRLSDALSSQIKDLYKSQGVDIEPSWHLVFLLLKKNQAMTMSELAEACRLSQPAMTKMIARIRKKGYITIAGDSEDNRKKVLTLSIKAINLMPKFEHIWDAGQKSIRDILRSNKAFLQSVEAIEQELAEKSFTERALSHLTDKS
ncbi:MAG: MarR family transcriptional regulator [Candidatus Zixiibacteriota bacterium]